MARTGTGTVLANQSKVVIADASVAANSQISIMLTSDASTKAGGAAISHITKSAGVGFTLYMTNPVQANITFDYLVS